MVAEENLDDLKVAPAKRIAFHSPCTLQHGQKITNLPKDLLRQAGFEVREIGEGHLCCGSAGTYNIMQPEIAGRLRNRKRANIQRTGAPLVATGNVGCMAQLSDPDGPPIVHTVELLDWATGGPAPARLAERAAGGGPDVLPALD